MPFLSLWHACTREASFEHQRNSTLPAVGVSRARHLNISDEIDAYANHSPLISLLCPPPINIILTANTFVPFLHDNQVNVGLVLSVNPMEQLLCIRLFLSWVDVNH
jgi:hypothetical protein